MCKIKLHILKRGSDFLSYKPEKTKPDLQAGRIFIWKMINNYSLLIKSQFRNASSHSSSLAPIPETRFYRIYQSLVYTRVWQTEPF